MKVTREKLKTTGAKKNDHFTLALRGKRVFYLETKRGVLVQRPVCSHRVSRDYLRLSPLQGHNTAARSHHLSCDCKRTKWENAAFYSWI